MGAQRCRHSRPPGSYLQLSIMVTCAEGSSRRLPNQQAARLLKAIAQLRTSSFSGVGVVFYEDLARLPHLQMTDGQQDIVAAGVVGDDLASKLAGISVMSSPLHDGFHFVDARSWQLTHLAQFISPPIPQRGRLHIRGTGARLMSAMLASLLPGISCVGLVSQNGEIHLFSGGVDVANQE